MKNLIKFAFIATVAIMMTSCSDDEPMSQGARQNQESDDGSLTIASNDFVGSFESGNITFKVSILENGTISKQKITDINITAVYTYDTSLFGKENPWKETVTTTAGNAIDMGWVKIVMLKRVTTPEITFMYDENQGEGRAVKIDIVAVTDDGHNIPGSYSLTQSAANMAGGCVDLHDALICPEGDSFEIPPTGGEITLSPTLADKYSYLRDRYIFSGCHIHEIYDGSTWRHWDYPSSTPTWVGIEKSSTNIKITLKANDTGTRRGVIISLDGNAEGEEVQLGLYNYYILFGNIELIQNPL